MRTMLQNQHRFIIFVLSFLSILGDTIGNYEISCDNKPCQRNVQAYYFCCQENDSNNRGEFSDKQICCDHSCRSFAKFCIESLSNHDKDSSTNIWIFLGIILSAGLLSLIFGYVVYIIRKRRLQAIQRALIINALHTNAIRTIQARNNLHAGYDQPPSYESQILSRNNTPARTEDCNDYSPFINEFLNDMNRNNSSARSTNVNSRLPENEDSSPPPSYEEATRQAAFANTVVTS